MNPEDYIARVRKAYDAAMGRPQPAPTFSDDSELGNVAWTFRANGKRWARVSITNATIVQASFVDGPPPSPPFHETEVEDARLEGADALGARIAAFLQS